MKKVGIVTLSASDNCGSLLQTFALQEILEKKCKCDVSVIDLKTEQSDYIYKLFPKGFYKHPKKTLFTIFHIWSITKQKRGYERFRKIYLNMTKDTYRTANDINEIVNDYDILVAGSDQVWNVYMSDYDDSFFLPWKMRGKKVAYAASLGSTYIIDEEKKKYLKKWLNDFDMISVREESGRKTIQDLTANEVLISADPTLLLSQDKWNALAGVRYIEKPYIFFYSWAYPDEEMNRIVQKFAKEKNMDVYVINSSKWYKYRPYEFDFHLFPESGPNVFLNLMKYAEYVFVQSFHGTVFANIFHKRFFFLSENGKHNVDFRSESLLRILNEEKQVIGNYDDIEEAMNSALEFESKELRKLSEGSLDFLKLAVGD